MQGSFSWIQEAGVPCLGKEQLVPSNGLRSTETGYKASMTKSDTRLEKMNLRRKPGHQKEEKAEHYRSHSEACHRYRQMLAVEHLKFIFVHAISLN
jgi:hypothetical protein